MPKPQDFDTTFEQLKNILEPYSSRLIVSADNPSLFTLEVDYVMKNKHRLYFGGVRKGKAYVSFYLMPVYASAELSGSISPALQKRRQGKSCFNFTSIDEPLLAELEDLAAKGIPNFRAVAEAMDAERSAARRTAAPA